MKGQSTLPTPATDKRELQNYLGLLEYELALQEAEDDLIRFAEVTMPDFRRRNDIAATKYHASRHHRVMADVMMQIERGEKRKVILNLPPRHGKSELCTKRMAAWFHGRNPDKDVIIATYNEKFAADFSKDVREILKSQRFRQVFPDYRLIQSSDERLKNAEGGEMFFLGRRSATTGRGGDLILVDDPTKDDKEIKFTAFREDCWQWFTQTLLTRRHTDRAAICVTQTRWHEDDIVGRITDSSNPAWSQEFSEGFEVIDLPAIALEDDVIGREPGEALWPARFGRQYLDEMRAANPTSFAALYQCDPTPEDGVYYSKDEIFEYDIDELPKNLRMYVASDHAVGTAQHNDATCMIPFGLDEEGCAWVMPHIAWKRMDAKAAVEEMLQIIEKHKPVYWYAEKGHISKAIGPFLRARMRETGVFVPILEDHPVADKEQRAVSARARCAQGRIRFPRFAPWWPNAKAELLKFPNGRFDDFVDTVSTIGNRLATHTNATHIRRKPTNKPGTFGHLLAQFKRDDAAARAAKARSGW